VHEEEFAEAGITDCKRCHVTGDWYPSLFDHSKTAFPLDGKHVDVECRECHKPDPSAGDRMTSFKIPKFECIDCHK
jgi:predicted CXXCH cytochrome family protein